MVRTPHPHCWELLKAMHGLRAASAEFDKNVETVTENLGCRAGLFNPRLCYFESERVGGLPVRNRLRGVWDVWKGIDR